MAVDIEYSDSEYIDCGVVSDLDGAVEASGMAWVKPEVTFTGDVCIYSKYGTGANANFHLRLRSGNVVWIYIYNNFSGYAGVQSTATVPAGVWTHIAWSWRASDNTVLLYLNGELQTLTTVTSSPPSSWPSNSAKLFIGSEERAAKYFDGIIHSVRLYETYFSTEAAVREEMLAELSAHPDLVEEWPLATDLKATVNSPTNDGSAVGGTIPFVDGFFDEVEPWNASDDFNDVGSGSSIEDRIPSDNPLFSYAQLPNYGVGCPVGDGAGGIAGSSGWEFAMIANRLGSRKLFNKKVSISWDYAAATGRREIIVIAHGGASAGQVWYEVYGDANGDHVIGTWINGTFTTLDTYDVGTPAVGKTMRLDIEPGSLKLYYDDTLVAESDDHKFTAPYMVGFRTNTSSSNMDNLVIECEDLDWSRYSLVAKDDAWDRFVLNSAVADVDGRSFPSDIGRALKWGAVGSFNKMGISASTFLFSGNNSVMRVEDEDGNPLTLKECRWGINRIGASAQVSLYLLKDYGTWANKDGYEFAIFPNGHASSALWKIENGSYTKLDGGAISWSPGDRFELQWKNGDIQALKNGEVVWSSADTTFAGESLTPVVWLSNTSQTVAEFALKEPAYEALELDGSADYVDFGDLTVFDALSTITFEGWIYPRANESSYFFAKHKSGGWTFNLTTIVGSSYPKLRADFYADPATTGHRVYWLTNSDALPLNTWSHFACCIDLSSGTGYLFVDGVLVASSKSTTGTPPTSIPNSATKLILGNSEDSPGLPFDGAISSLAVWNTQKWTAGFTPPSQRYNGTEEGLIFYLPMNEGIGSEITDIVGEETGAIQSYDASMWVPGPSLDPAEVPEEPSAAGGFFFRNLILARR